MSDPRVQEFKHRMGELLIEAPPEDGVGAGLLAIAAEHYAKELVEAYGLDGERVPIAEYLIGCWGEIVHCFQDSAQILPGYYVWREACRQKALSSLKEPND